VVRARVDPFHLTESRGPAVAPAAGSFYARIAAPMELLSQIRWLDILDIVIVSFMAYRLWVWMRGTRALQILVGLLALGVISLLAVRYQLSTTAWIFSNLWTVLLLLILIVFQPELRRMLERVSPLKLLTGRPAEEVDRSLAEVRDAAFELGAARIGALMAVAREDPVEEHLTDGIPLDGRVSRQVLVSLFQRESPVHDGAALIRGDRIISVGNYLPLTDRAALPSHLGTRHRSALGLSETCDAVVVVVSEERGEVAIARAGHLTSCADSATLEAELRTLIRPADAPSVEGRRFFRALTRDPIGKLGALVFAGVLWGLFAAPVDYQRIIPQVPIDYRFPEHAAAVGDLPRRAEVMVTGSQMSLGRLRPDEISVSVDLANLGKGTHGVNLTDAAVIVPPGVRVVTIRGHHPAAPDRGEPRRGGDALLRRCRAQARGPRLRLDAAGDVGRPGGGRAHRPQLGARSRVLGGNRDGGPCRQGGELGRPDGGDGPAGGDRAAKRGPVGGGGAGRGRA